MGREATRDRVGRALQISVTFVLVLFLVEALDRLLILRSGGAATLDSRGIVPRTSAGLLGIVFSPMLHGNLAHLLSNAVPLFVLVTLLFWDRHYRPAFTLMLIWVASGLGTWLIGRPNSIHIGASSIIYGLVTYLIVSGFLMKSWRSTVIAIFVLLLYGGILYGVLPRAGPISWEGHLSGALAGIWAARDNHT